MEQDRLGRPFPHQPSVSLFLLDVAVAVSCSCVRPCTVQLGMPCTDGHAPEPLAFPAALFAGLLTCSSRSGADHRYKVAGLPAAVTGLQFAQVVAFDMFRVTLVDGLARNDAAIVALRFAAPESFVGMFSRADG